MTDVFFPRKTSKEYLSYFENLLSPGITIHWGPEKPENIQYSVLISGRPTIDEISASNKLETVIIPFAGIPKDTIEILANYPHIKVINLHHNDSATAEIAISLLMSACKLIIPYDAMLRKNNWELRYQPPRAILLDGKNALILGYGHIGRRVAKVCSALGMSVTAIRKSITCSYHDQDGIAIHPITDLYSFLGKSNILIICLPLTKQTEKLLGSRELDLMPAGSIIVNVGRGAIIDEQALFENLKNQHIAAAGLDVWWVYPENEDSRSNTSPSKYPFQDLENVVLSPHRGGATTETEKLRYSHLANTLNLIHMKSSDLEFVDLNKGY